MKKIRSNHWASDTEKLDEFILGRIDEEKRSILTAHLQRCKPCRQRLQIEQGFVLGIRRHGRLEMKRRLKLRLQRDKNRRFEWAQVTSMAAAIMIMLGAVFAVRWFVNIERIKPASREIVFNKDVSSQQAIWIMGKVVPVTRKFRGTVSERGSSFIIKQGNTKQIISIRHASFAELPLAMRKMDENKIQTLLERTPDGLRLTMYTESTGGTFATGVETVSLDSLVVYLQGQQIAYHVPNGWIGVM